MNNRENSDKRNTAILVLDNNDSTLKSINELLAHSGYKVSLCADTEDAMSILNSKCFNIVLINVNANELSCLEFLGKIRNHDPYLPVILMVNAANLTLAINAVKNGAFDIIPKPYTPVELIGYLDKAAEHCAPTGQKQRISYI